MKTSFLILFFFCSQIVMGQPFYKWYRLNAGVSTNLNLVLNDGNLVAGDNGLILRTLDQGISWSVIQSGTTSRLNSGVRTSFGNFLIVGENGTILKSTNSGSNWILSNSGTSLNLSSIAYIEGTLMAVGSSGILIKSTNEGDTWTQVSIQTSVNLNVVYYSNFSEAWIGGDNGLLFKTTNGGASFTQIFPGTNENIYDIKFNDAGILTGSNGLIMKSTDFGSSWILQSSGIADTLKTIYMVNDNEIFTAGTGGKVLKTTNGGSLWQQQIGFEVTTYNDFGRTSFLRTILAGNAGAIYIYSPDSVANSLFRLNPGNISSWFFQRGIFNQDLTGLNKPGFEWPKGSGKFAVFTTGVCTGAYINGGLRLASASYTGEYGAGYTNNGKPVTNPDFKLYKVTKGDNASSNPDYANWYLMVPFGAPYNDVNSNGQFDPNIDIPGVKNAQQTMFISLTDAFPENHSSSEGFSGGTEPLGADMRITAWGYNSSSMPFLSDVQFVKFQIINKNLTAWANTKIGLVTDPDLGDNEDDYIGCDTSLSLGFCYNSDNADGDGTGITYGINPPAVGFDILNKKLSSFIYFNNTSVGGSPCETDPDAPPQAYNYLNGKKKDSTSWINPLTMIPTKFTYTGDPETYTGWRESSGRIENCGGASGGPLVQGVAGDRRMVMNIENPLTINPGDSTIIFMAQMIARGTNNLNSVTKLKQLSAQVQTFFDEGMVIAVENIGNIVPEIFTLYQNYPNPFNPVTKIKFDIPQVENSQLSIVKLRVYDVAGKEVAVLVNQHLNPGTYEAKFDGSKFASGVYFYALETGNYSNIKKMVLVK